MRVDSKPIEGIKYYRDKNGEVVFDYLQGAIPLIISAPHAGWRTYEPTGASVFGSRKQDASPPQPPTNLNKALSLGGFNDVGGDYGTRYIAFGIVRYLVQNGFRPHAIFNRVVRYHADVNRPWGQQHHWELESGSSPLITNPDGMDPDYYDDYYAAYHEILRSMVREVSPSRGWLFDIHGEGGGVPQVRFATHRGVTARSDAIYEGTHSLISLVQVAGLTPEPNNVNDEATGYSFTNGFLYGATPPSKLGVSAALPLIPSHGRVHGVQVEISSMYRNPPGTTGFNYMNNITYQHISWLEDIGSKLGQALAGFLLARNLV
jgi:hypothetical protein